MKKVANREFFCENLKLQVLYDVDWLFIPIAIFWHFIVCGNDRGEVMRFFGYFFSVIQVLHKSVLGRSNF